MSASTENALRAALSPLTVHTRRVESLSLTRSGPPTDAPGSRPDATVRVVSRPSKNTGGALDDAVEARPPPPLPLPLPALVAGGSLSRTATAAVADAGEPRV